MSNTLLVFYECARLNAKISRAQCKYNGQRMFACEGCPGLGAAVNIDMEVVMAAKVCKVAGCASLSQSQKNGMCKRHFTECQDKLMGAVVDEIARVSLNPPQGALVMGNAFVFAEEITSVDYIAYLRQLLDERLEEWASDLNKATTPKERAQWYLSMCTAAEGLGY